MEHDTYFEPYEMSDMSYAKLCEMHQRIEDSANRCVQNLINATHTGETSFNDQITRAIYTVLAGARRRQNVVRDLAKRK